MEKEQIRHLLIKISQKDEAAFKLLFESYYPKLIQISLAFVPGVIAAQEVVSDVFYKLLKNPQSLIKIKDFDNYVFLAVKNQSYTFLKKNRRKSMMESVEGKADYILPELKNPESSLLSEELFQLVEKVVKSLPPKRKVIFQLIKEERKKYREVAEILDISIKTVELQMSLALKQLRKSVNEYHESKDIKIRKISGGNGLLFILFLIFCGFI